MKKAAGVFLAVILVFSICAGTALGAQPKMTKKQYKKQLAYNKNFLPAGWQYEAGYTLWRAQRGLPANRQTYRKYQRDRNWRLNLHNKNRAGEILLDGMDWTADEIAYFLENYGDSFKFQPAGPVE